MLISKLQFQRHQMSSEIFNRAQDVLIASCLGNAMNMISDGSLLITHLLGENNHAQRKTTFPSGKSEAVWGAAERVCKDTTSRA